MGRACMIAAIATDADMAGTGVATGITIKAALIAGAAVNAMVATRASSGRDAAKGRLRRPLMPG